MRPSRLFPYRACKLTLSAIIYLRLFTAVIFRAFGNILFHFYITEFSIVSAVPSG